MKAAKNQATPVPPGSEGRNIHAPIVAAQQRPDKRPPGDPHFREQRREKNREGGRESDEGTKRTRVKPSQQPCVLAPEDHELFAQRRLNIAYVVHAPRGGKGREQDQRNPDKGGVLQPDFAYHVPTHIGLGPTALDGQRAAEDYQGRHCQHDTDAQIAGPGVPPERGTLHPLGEEETDIGHGSGEIAAAEPAQERNS
jgi:hypothetical protein